MDQLWYLKKIDMFKVLSKEELAFLIENAKGRTYQKNQLIFSPDDVGNQVYLITRGRVKLYNLSPCGRESILFIFIKVRCLDYRRCLKMIRGFLSQKHSSLRNCCAFKALESSKW
jgi:CRP-like cAMP-binding protein